jgi:uncharacterized protein with PIN domain
MTEQQVAEGWLAVDEEIKALVGQPIDRIVMKCSIYTNDSRDWWRRKHWRRMNRKTRFRAQLGRRFLI